jgi:hypothetical protein
MGWDGRYPGPFTALWLCRCAWGGGAGNERTMQCNLSIYMYSLPTLPRFHCATLSIHTTLLVVPRLISPIPTVLLRTSGTTMTVSP